LISLGVATIVVDESTNRLALVGSRVTELTGTIETVTVAPGLVFPSLVAVILVVPTASAVTTPDEFTLATVGTLDAHVTTRPVSVLLLTSFRVAANALVESTNSAALVGARVTELTGTFDTVTVAAVLVTPSLVAVMFVGPGVNPFTTPDELTLATLGAVDPQLTTRPVRILLPASFRTAVNV